MYSLYYIECLCVAIILLYSYWKNKVILIWFDFFFLFFYCFEKKELMTLLIK